MNNYNNECNNETSRGLVLQAYNTIMDMLSFDNLYDDNNHENIYAQIIKIKYMKPFLPNNIFDTLSSFIENDIEPIIDNDLALEEFQTAELGCTNEDGVFEFKDDMCAKLFIGRVIKHCIELQEKFLKIAMDEIRPYFQ